MKKAIYMRIWKFLGLLVFGVIATAGCAYASDNIDDFGDTNSVNVENGTSRYISPEDPYENFNRQIYKFNQTLDRFIIRPIATGYSDILPWQVRKGVTNFFDNLNEFPIVVNDLLQFKIKYAISDTWRFIFNSTLGIGGLFDVASHFRLEKHYEDFGLTFAAWGCKDAPYLVLPLFGPRTLRETFAIPFTFVVSINYSARPAWLFMYINGLKWIDIRANLLKHDKLIEEAFDPYIFVRDAYLQHRAYLIDQNNGIIDKDYLEETHSDSTVTAKVKQ